MAIDPGIYFHMSEEEYLADEALSSSGVRDLLISPLTYWVHSAMCDWPDRESEAMKNGSAFHTRIIEGRDAFDSRYAIVPNRADFPNALDGGADLRAWLKDAGLKVSGTISELCERIREADPNVELWTDIMRDFDDSAEGKIRLAPDTARQIEFRARIIDRHPVAQKAFRGGFPEVSIFWTDQDTGIPMKARVDYLKPKAIVEVKTFANHLNKPLQQAVVNAIANHRYHIAAAVYLDAVEQAKRLIREDPAFVHDDMPDDWRREFLDGPHAYVFVFIETGAVPNLILREYRSHRKDGEVNFYWHSGDQHYRHALQIYKRCMETFGTDPWIEPEPMMPLQDEEFPVWME